jgi:hypothetical protein
VFVQALIAQPPFEAFDKAILHRLAGCDVVPLDPKLLLPSQDRVRGVGEANNLRLRDVIPFRDGKGRSNFRFIVRGKNWRARCHFALRCCTTAVAHTIFAHMASPLANATVSVAATTLIVRILLQPVWLTIAVVSSNIIGPDCH